MGRRKRGRDIDGIVLLDKPLGCSSNSALQRVRRAFDARKAGHTGSLDPLASGLLPVCLGEATKVSSYLLAADKRYRVTALHGIQTATGDREGEVIARSDVPMPDRERLDALLADFVGAQQQIPPMYSALKKDGKRLYEHARAGETIEREPRDITVHEIQLLDCDAESFTLEARVSSGTYIRTLVEDIAAAWGGVAHVGTLHRTAIGRLGRDLGMTPLAEIEARAERGDDLGDWLLPVSIAIADRPRVVLDADRAAAMGHGRAVECDVPASQAETLRIEDEQGCLLGLGYIDDAGRLAPRRLFARAQR
ncbi:tRNA pseudouridine(55) synthase TruB [Salinisphaera sp. T31B1]|uniref:tRNA pseudouridine(55) synthase TruB n=1 Tax=Salinisphaera sp. T31B1 TaxID=727963 RepID=UPI003342CDC3